MIRNLRPIWIMLLYVFFYNVKLILFCIVLLYCRISSLLFKLLDLFSFHMHMFLYVSIESIDCIFLSSFEVKTILLISSLKALCLSLLNLCCAFDTDLLFLMNIVHGFLRLLMLILDILDVNFINVHFRDILFHFKV